MKWITHTLEPWMPVGATKAKDDVADIAQQNEYMELIIDRANKIADLSKIQKGDLIVHQYPTYLGDEWEYDFIEKVHSLSGHLAIFIHDLEFFRIHAYSNKDLSIKLLINADLLIVHTEQMADTLKSLGIDTPMVVLRLFDYLGTKFKQNQVGKVVYAGTLAKADWIYDYDQKPAIHLFGKIPQNKEQPESKYILMHPPFDETRIITEIARYEWGLVFDQDSSEKTTYEKYQEINSPHKLSLYLSAGIPVIVPNSASTAKWVIENKIGVAIDSPLEINNKIKNTEINSVFLNDISQKINSGYFTTTALKQVERLLNKD